MQTRFLPGLALESLPSKPATVSLKNAPLSAPPPSKTEETGEANLKLGGAAATTQALSLPSSLEEEEEEELSGAETPAPPSPMHLMEQQELLELSKSVAHEAMMRSQNALRVDALQENLLPRQEPTTPSSSLPESGALKTPRVSAAPETQAPSSDGPVEGEEGRKAEGQREEDERDEEEADSERRVKRPRRGSEEQSHEAKEETPPEDDPSSKATGDVAESLEGVAKFTGGLLPPPRLVAAAEAFSNLWREGLCAAAKGANEAAMLNGEGGRRPSEEAADADFSESNQNNDELHGAHAFSLAAAGPPGVVEGETRPVFCPICSGLYRELPGGGPGDGLHWIGCDGETQLPLS